MKSESIKEIAAALAAAQREMKSAVKDSANPFFKSKYADLASVIDAAREPLAKHGLAVSQTMGAINGQLTLTTILMHSSGEWIVSEYPIMPARATALKTLIYKMEEINAAIASKKSELESGLKIKSVLAQVAELLADGDNDPQALGSAITYARRYCLSSICGIASDDDDGNKASGKDESKPEPTYREPIARPEAKKPEVCVAPTQSGKIAENETMAQIQVAEVQERNIGKDGKKLIKYGIIATTGEIFGTFSEAFADMARLAKKDGLMIKLTYKTKGQFKDILTCEFPKK